MFARNLREIKSRVAVSKLLSQTPWVWILLSALAILSAPLFSGKMA